MNIEDAMRIAKSRGGLARENDHEVAAAALSLSRAMSRMKACATDENLLEIVLLALEAVDFDMDTMQGTMLSAYMMDNYPDYEDDQLAEKCGEMIYHFINRRLCEKDKKSVFFDDDGEIVYTNKVRDIWQSKE